MASELTHPTDLPGAPAAAGAPARLPDVPRQLSRVEPAPDAWLDELLAGPAPGTEPRPERPGSRFAAPRLDDDLLPRRRPRR